MVTIALGGRAGGHAIVDADDYNNISIIKKYSWSVDGHGYARISLKKRTVLLHRLVMGNPKGHVHHKNGCLLDNRKANLEVLSHKQHLRQHWQEKRLITAQEFEIIKNEFRPYKVTVKQLSEKYGVPYKRLVNLIKKRALYHPLE